MKYVMMICDDENTWENLSDADRKAGYEEIYAHINKWEARGRYIDGGAELQSRATARTARANGSGEIIVTDGPYTELKELVGGFMMIEADTIDDAMETASEWPGIKYGAVVEVRPIVTQEMRDAG
jgi:hypothetical protein